jgi:GT2 family glycosyltransferase
LDIPLIKEISYASGAAFFVSAEMIRNFGAWDEDFFLYHEDMEWSLRLRAAGYRIIMASESVFYHKYQFARSIEKFYWMERNRYGVMLMFFRIPTLLLLLPIMLGLEIGLWIFSFINKYADKRVAVYKYWLRADHWKLWLKKRRRIQKIRTVSDRYLMSYAVSGIYFQDASVDNPLVNYIANPVMAMYYWLVVKGLIWW